MKTPLLIAVAGLCTLPNAQADIIFQYNLHGNAGNESSVAGLAPIAGITALDLTRGSGLNSTATGNSFSSSGWEFATPANPADSLEYISFGFQIAAGIDVILDNLVLTTRSSNTGPGTLGLYSSIDSFTNLLHTFAQTGEDFLDSTITGLASLGTLSNQTVEFRIIEIGNTQADGVGSTTSGGTFRLTNFDQDSAQPITLSGTVTAAIPEPPGFISCLVAASAIAFVRRRQNRNQSTHAGPTQTAV